MRGHAMAGGEFRVFISAVTSEFGKARSAIAADLRAKGLLVKVQDDFRPEARNDTATLLGLLREYIQSCDAVVCVIGKRSGACPKPAEAKYFEHPRILPPGIDEASYTQWELFFARYYKRRLSTYVAADDYKPDEAKPSGPDFPGLQAAYVQHLKDEGLYRNPFSTSETLRIAVLKEDWEFRQRLRSASAPSSKPIVLPYPSIGHLFKGRTDFLKQLHESLTRAGGGKTAIFNAVYGMGGIGKTRAAVEYAWAHHNDYSAALFVRGETPELLRTNFGGLSAILVPDLETTDEATHVRAVLAWLEANPDWLLILDNLDTTEALAEGEHLMAQCSGGHVIITSRLSNFAGEIQPLELGVLGKDDAAAFLLERTEGRRRPAADDAAKAREIAAELGNLALALEQAAAYVAARKLTFDEYLEQWLANRDKVMAWSDPAVTHYPRAVAITWQTSVEQLTPAGRRLLERLAWLAPEPIPDFLLGVRVPGAEGENLQDTFADLAAYSLVTRDVGGPFIFVHRLVQDVTRRSLDAETRARSLGQALNWINDAFAGNPADVRDWPRLEAIVPHALAVAGRADSAGIVKPTSRLMTRVAMLLSTKALHTEAEPLIRRALAIDEERLGPDHPIVAANLNNLALLLRATSRLAEAEALMRRALVIDEKNLGPDHPTVAARLNNLVGLLQEANQLGDTEQLMRRALAIDEQNFGPDHPYLARDLNNLALVLQDANRLADAEPLIRRALAIDEKSLGPDHPSVATDLNNLGRLLQATDRLHEAEPLCRRALEIDEKWFGQSHPDVARDLNNLAGLLEVTDRLAEAEPLMRQSVAIFVDFARRTGHQDPKFESSIRNYAILLHAMGKTEAEVITAIESVLNEPA